MELRMITLRVGYRNFLLGLVVVLLCASVGNAQRGGRGGGGQDQFRFRFIGPAVGNRVSAIAGIPGDGRHAVSNRRPNKSKSELILSASAASAALRISNRRAKQNYYQPQ